LFPVVTVTDSTQRRTPKAAKTSSVFKKVVMAISGIILVLYLIAHMIGNLKAFSGAEDFNHYSEWLRTIGNPALPGATALWLIRVVLLVAVLAHMWAAVSLWRQAKRARPQAYVTKKSVAQSYASRTMRWGGVIILAFIIFHILDLTLGAVNAEGRDGEPFDRMLASFQNPVVTAFYAISVILVGMHLRHGIWSATQTLGQSNRRREVTVNYAATAIATVLTIGFLLTPFAVLFGLID
jgi:succinate dehydrogenase / fumarate reductase cytochrome b subunit